MGHYVAVATPSPARTTARLKIIAVAQRPHGHLRLKQKLRNKNSSFVNYYSFGRF